jgi:hypothetical protein
MKYIQSANLATLQAYDAKVVAGLNAADPTLGLTTYCEPQRCLITYNYYEYVWMVDDDDTRNPLQYLSGAEQATLSAYTALSTSLNTTTTATIVNPYYEVS